MPRAGPPPARPYGANPYSSTRIGCCDSRISTGALDVLQTGRVVLEGTSQDPMGTEMVRHAYLGM